MTTGPVWRDAKWCVHEDGARRPARLQLQIALQNGNSVLLAPASEDGRPREISYSRKSGLSLLPRR
jgi:hypothetical protein